MAGPALRAGDMVMADVVILPDCAAPTVLIGGQPAATAPCSLKSATFTGVIPSGSPTVLIGGKPAIRALDTATLVNTASGVTVTIPCKAPAGVMVLIGP